MDKTVAKVFIIPSIAATIGLLISQNTPGLQSAITVPMAAWILFQFRNPERAWNSLGLFKNPILFGINLFFASFIYLSWKTVHLDKTVYLSAGVFLLGGVASTLLSKYWNIGG